MDYDQAAYQLSHAFAIPPSTRAFEALEALFKDPESPAQKQKVALALGCLNGITS
jgi:hypothetical protein